MWSVRNLVCTFILAEYNKRGVGSTTDAADDREAPVLPDAKLGFLDGLREPRINAEAPELFLYFLGISPYFYCESSAFTVKFQINASTSPLAGQPVLMHKKPHALTAFMVCGAIVSHGDLLKDSMKVTQAAVVSFHDVGVKTVKKFSTAETAPQTERLMSICKIMASSLRQFQVNMEIGAW